jgi:hypothetical protein
MCPWSFQGSARAPPIKLHRADPLRASLRSVGWHGKLQNQQFPLPTDGGSSRSPFGTEIEGIWMTLRKSDLKILGSIVIEETGDVVLPLSIGIGKDAHLIRVPLALSKEDIGNQQHYPVSAIGDSASWWVFRGVVVDASELGIVAPEHQEEFLLRIKHPVLSREKALAEIRREVEAFENLSRLPTARREAIPEAVRMFVWQRDEGKCVKCGCREKLEFDHIIPVADGGSSTERNVQLLCEACNRRKGKNLS